MSFPMNMLYVISRTLGIHGCISVRGRVCKWVNRYVTVSWYIRYHWLEALGWVPLWIDFSPPVTHNVIIKSYKWSIYFEQCKAITFNCLTGYKVNKLNKIIVIVNLPALENTQWSLTQDRCMLRTPQIMNSQQVASDVMANALAITCMMHGIVVIVDKYVIMYDMYSWIVNIRFLMQS